MSSLPAYDLTGGVWVSGQPLMINSDFDFSLAMADLDFGAGLAAGQRLKQNQEAAERFRDMPPLALDGLWKSSLQAAPGLTREDRDWLRHQPDVALFGILFGAPGAQLRVVLEIGGQRWVWIGTTRPLDGPDSWTADKGRRAAEGFSEALPELIALLPQRRGSPESTEAQSYRIVAEGIAPDSGLGWVLERKSGRVVVRSKSIPATIISYPELVFVAE